MSRRQGRWWTLRIVGYYSMVGTVRCLCLRFCGDRLPGLCVDRRLTRKVILHCFEQCVQVTSLGIRGKDQQFARREA